MAILLAFAPFIAFAVVAGFVGGAAGLVAGTAISAALVLRDWMTSKRAPKVLEAGTLVLFGGLTLYTVLADPKWSIIDVRVCVDAGLLLIVLASLALGRPFTLQYAREQVAREFWDRPQFIRTNYVITTVWALAFVVMVTADLALLYAPELPPRVGIIATIIAIVGAFKFTRWYPERQRAAAPH